MLYIRCVFFNSKLFSFKSKSSSNKESHSDSESSFASPAAARPSTYSAANFDWGVSSGRYNLISIRDEYFASLILNRAWCWILEQDAYLSRCCSPHKMGYSWTPRDTWSVLQVTCYRLAVPLGGRRTEGMSIFSLPVPSVASNNGI